MDIAFLLPSPEQKTLRSQRLQSLEFARWAFSILHRSICI